MSSQEGTTTFSLGSYEEARAVMETVDADRLPRLTEYRDIHRLEPTRLEIEYAPGGNPTYTLHFETDDDITQQMLEDGDLEETLEGETSFSDARQIRKRLG